MRLLEVGKNVKWWVGEKLGDHEYEHYIEHLRLFHPDRPVPCERQYWHDRHQQGAINPGCRCC